MHYLATETKINIYNKSQEGLNALHLAIKKNFIEVVKLLIGLNYDLNI